jgi:sorbitol/mannitol transport system substrate-binding protein
LSIKQRYGLGYRSSTRRGQPRHWWVLGSVVSAVSLAAIASGTAAGVAKVSSHSSKVTIKVAVVSNSNMINIEKLTPAFEKQNPGIKVTYDTLNENNERSLIETDISTHANEFNAVMISNYETPIWAKNGWLVNLTPALKADTSYDISDLVEPIANALSYNGSLYGVPFYAESSMVYYRKDLFKAAGLTMPLHPRWSQIASFARKLNDPSKGVAGICLRGQSGWGENLAALDTVINTAGGSWFNDKWQPELTSPADKAAVNFYVNLVRSYGEPGASNDGFTECETAYGEGKAAMWYDATVAAGLIATSYPQVSANTGYAYAPTGTPTGGPGVSSGWQYTWSLSIPKGVPNTAATEKYLEWATGKQYIAYSGPRVGWANIDPGTRYSTYSLPQYKKAAHAFAGITLASINAANADHPTDASVAVPYTGVQFVDEPWFISLGTEVSDQISAAIAGTESVSQALETSQQDAMTTVKQAGLLK